MGELIRIAFITLVSQKGLKAIGKKDWSDIVKFMGVCLFLVNGYAFVKSYTIDPVVNSSIVKGFKWFMNFFKFITGASRPS